MTARFQRPSAVNLKNVEDFAQYMDALLGEVEMALNESSRYTEQVKIHREPAKKTEGLTVLADGSDWNPGDGEGLYRWNGSAWVKVDNSTSTVTAAAVLTDDQFVVGAGGARGVETVTAAQARNLIGLDSDDDVTFHSLIVHGTTGGDPALTVRGTTGNPKIELGRVDGSTSIPHIDFHSGATAVDYDARIRGDGGTGVSGGGSLNFQCASLLFNSQPVRGLVLLTSGSVSGAATLDIVLTSYTGYRGIVIELTDLRSSTDSVLLYMRTSTDGGSNYDAGANDYRYNQLRAFHTNSISNSTVTGASQIVVADSIGNATADSLCVTAKILGQTKTAVGTKIEFSGTQHASTDNQVRVLGDGRRITAQDTDAVRFLASSGNISADYAVYGLV